MQLVVKWLIYIFPDGHNLSLVFTWKRKVWSWSLVPVAFTAARIPEADVNKC